jgi:3-phenylpropionate/trans-cinnamate dioxygenase ferredoxin subunit
MNFIKAAQTNDLAPGSKLKVTVQGNTILLANINGSYYAIDNKCPHLGGSLADGNLDGENIVCPRHGSVFSVKTGKFVSPGKLLFVKVNTHDTQSYPVKVEGADILIGME